MTFAQARAKRDEAKKLLEWMQCQYKTISNGFRASVVSKVGRDNYVD